jgi:kynurenine formamidase
MPPRSPADRKTAPRAALAVVFLALFVGAGCRDDRAPLPSRLVDLTPPITPDINLERLGRRTLEFLGVKERAQVSQVVPDDPSMAFGIQMLHVMSHTGAHIDAPARLLRGGDSPDRIPLERLFGRARVIDLRWHNRHTPIQITDLELTPMEPDEIVLLLLGYEPPATEEWPLFAPLSVQVSEWLAAKGIRALATDLPTITRFDDLERRLHDHRPPEEVWAEYLPFFRARIPVMTGLINIETVVREDKLVFAGFPLPMANAAGAPIRAVALVY